MKDVDILLVVLFTFVLSPCQKSMILRHHCWSTGSSSRRQYYNELVGGKLCFKVNWLLINIILITEDPLHANKVVRKFCTLLRKWTVMMRLIIKFYFHFVFHFHPSIRSGFIVKRTFISITLYAYPLNAWLRSRKIWDELNVAANAYIKMQHWKNPYFLDLPPSYIITYFRLQSLFHFFMGDVSIAETSCTFTTGYLQKWKVSGW